MQQLVLIGASTGGPGHIKQIVKRLSPSTNTSFIIAQHMNKDMLKSFVSQLSTITSLPVYLAESKTEVLPASIYICKESLELSYDGKLTLQNTTKESIYSPCIDTLFLSARNFLPKYKIIAFILTGIGDDGTKGMLSLYDDGALCIVESKESAKVYGMPKAVLEKNSHIEAIHIDDIITYLKHV